MKKILYVVHAFPPFEYSGTPLIAYQYALEACKRGYKVAIAFPGDEKAVETLTQHHEYRFEFISLPRADEGNWALEAFQKSSHEIRKIPEHLALFSADIIHIIDWVYMPGFVLSYFKELKVPVVRHVWNFEDICPRISPCFYYEDARPCPAPLSAENCAECLTKTLIVNLPAQAGLNDILVNLTALRNKKIVEFTGKIKNKWHNFSAYNTFYNILIFPCYSFKNYFNSHVKLDNIEHVIVEHGVVQADRSSFVKMKSGGIFTFIYLGGSELVRKGWPQIEKVFKRLLEVYPGKVKLMAYGIPDSAQTGSILTGLPGVQMHGNYNHEFLSEILNKGDIGLVPSAFETFNRVSREMLYYGLPVIGSRAFGIPEVVKHEVNGLILETLDEHEFYEAVSRLLNDTELLDRLTNGAELTKIKTISEEFDELAALYCKMENL